MADRRPRRFAQQHVLAHEAPEGRGIPAGGDLGETEQNHHGSRPARGISTDGVASSHCGKLRRSDWATDSSGLPDGHLTHFGMGI